MLACAECCWDNYIRPEGLVCKGFAVLQMAVLDRRQEPSSQKGLNIIARPLSDDSCSKFEEGVSLRIPRSWWPKNRQNFKNGDKSGIRTHARRQRKENFSRKPERCALTTRPSCLHHQCSKRFAIVFALPESYLFKAINDVVYL